MTAQKLIIDFDYDNTLATTEHPAMSLAHQLAQEELFKRNIKHVYPQDPFIEHFTGYTFGGMMKELSQTHGFELSDAEHDALVIVEREMQIARLPYAEGFGPTEGVMQVLDELSMREAPMCVVTSTAIPRVIVCSDKLDQTRYFGKERFFSAQTTLNPARPKPLPDIYEHAVRVMGGTKEDHVAIEDSKSGILSAKRAGIANIIGYVGVHHEDKQAKHAKILFENGAHFVMDHMSHFIPLYDMLCDGHFRQLRATYGPAAWKDRILASAAA